MEAIDERRREEEVQCSSVNNYGWYIEDHKDIEFGSVACKLEDMCRVVVGNNIWGVKNGESTAINKVESLYLSVLKYYVAIELSQFHSMS